MGGLGCDNMTCVLVCLLHNKPYQVMVERCARLAREREEEIRRKVSEELEQAEESLEQEASETPAIT